MKYNIKIEQVQDVFETPRDWCNLGKMVCFHKRYDLGDKHEFNSSMFDSWYELERHLINKYNAVVILPLYLYDHSGITMSTMPFSCPWDSGRVGFIYADRESILKEYKIKRITEKIKQKVKDVLFGEVNVYDQYLRGDIYSFTITDENDNEIGSDYEIYGYDECEKQANDMVEQLKNKSI
jgi:hypothetical protein